VNAPTTHGWTRNGARVVCALLLALGALTGAATSIGHVPTGSANETPYISGIDLNTAPAHELELLPGIGPALSESIVRDRENNGPFAELDDITRVKGIGERRVMGIGPHAVVREPLHRD